MEAFETLKTQVTKIFYKELPIVAMAVAFELRYKVDVAGLWEVLLGLAEQNAHHYTPLEIAQLRQATAGTFPKVGTEGFHKQLVDIVTLEMH